jgi:hypothetical protein
MDSLLSRSATVRLPPRRETTCQDPFVCSKDDRIPGKGGRMISSDCDFEQFVREISGKDYYDVIYLAEKEATQAWRRNYRNLSGTCGNEASRKYQAKLIDLILFMRHGLKPKSFSEQDFQLCIQLNNEYTQPQRSVAPDAHLNLA